jgi:PAS domain S-box-containing protein
MKKSYHLLQDQNSMIARELKPVDEGQSFLEILYDVSRELTGSLDLHTVLTRVLVLSARNLGAERASLIVLDKAQKPMDAVVLYHGEVTSTDQKFIRNVIRTGLAGWVKRNRQPALVVDTHNDERWIDLPYDGKIVREAKSALCVPVMRQDQLNGMLTLVHPQTNYFNLDHQKLLQSIADIAGIAIHNALLYLDLEENRNLYRGLFEGVADPIFVTSFDGSIVEFNKRAREVSGYTKTELLKMNISSFEDRAQKTLDGLDVGKGRAYFKRYESRLRTKAQNEMAVEVRVSWNEAFDHNYILWIFNDISEREKLEMMRESMTAMIYHDLRSPLANITSSLELLSDAVTAGETSQLGLLMQIAERSCAHMQRLISSLLDINRLESGQAIVKKYQVDLGSLIDEAVEIVSPLAASREIELEKLVPAEIQPFALDADMIRRVLINLLENAIKFSPLHSRVTIGFKPEAEGVLVFVEDQGSGIPDIAKGRIFEKYARLDVEGRTRGLGLGLAFCRLALQAHGGTIWVENNKPDGSRFVFRLPVYAKSGSDEE